MEESTRRHFHNNFWKSSWKKKIQTSIEKLPDQSLKNRRFSENLYLLKKSLEKFLEKIPKKNIWEVYRKVPNNNSWRHSFRKFLRSTWEYNQLSKRNLQKNSCWTYRCILCHIPHHTHKYPLECARDLRVGAKWEMNAIITSPWSLRSGPAFLLSYTSTGPSRMENECRASV